MATPGHNIPGCSLCWRSARLSTGERAARAALLWSSADQVTPSCPSADVTDDPLLSFGRWCLWDQIPQAFWLALVWTESRLRRYLRATQAPASSLSGLASSLPTGLQDSGSKKNKGMLDIWWQYQHHGGKGRQKLCDVPPRSQQVTTQSSSSGTCCTFVFFCSLRDSANGKSLLLPNKDLIPALQAPNWWGWSRG